MTKHQELERETALLLIERALERLPLAEAHGLLPVADALVLAKGWLCPNRPATYEMSAAARREYTRTHTVITVELR